MFLFAKSRALAHFRALFTNRWAFGCFGLLTLQQLIEASATFWLVFMVRKIHAQENFTTALLLYLFSLAFPYVPGCLAYIIKISWKQEAQRFFLNAFVSANRNQIGEWNNKSIKEEKLSILSAEGPMALHTLIDYVFDLYSYVINVFFNICALCLIVEPLFGWAYGFSVVTVVGIMKLKKRTQRRLTHKALTARIDLYQSLLAAWDNVLLGNPYNFRIWEEKTHQKLNRCLRKNVALERFDQVLAIWVSLLTSVPAMGIVVYYVYLHRTSTADLTSFLVTLPVLFTILSYTYQTLSLIFRWTMHKSKLVSIYRAIEPIQEMHATMAQKVKWPKIQMTYSQNVEKVSLKGPAALSSCQELLLHAEQAGRVTLRGENGSGKSTLLMMVKDLLSDRAFFLPTHNQLSFLAETHKQSTGESLRHRLLEIIEKVDTDVLLLDEWDANLDKENQERLSKLIDELATKKCVIEVRHRG